MSDAPAGSAALTLYTPEAALLAQSLGDGQMAAELVTRLWQACAQAQANGAPTLQLQDVTPLEQGLLMAALRQCTCQFSMGLRVRVQQMMVGQLLDLNAPTAL